jgi:hypothetical protein
LPLNTAGLLDTYGKAKTTEFFGLANGNNENIIKKFLIANTNHRLIASIR